VRALLAAEEELARQLREITVADLMRVAATRCDLSEAERRCYPRRYGRRKARVNISVGCTICDISRSGARLLIDQPASLPDEFEPEIRLT